MKTLHYLLFAVSMTLCIENNVASAQQSPMMKLLAPQTGWMQSGQQLYWTVDNGTHWSDISPSTNGMVDVLFQDMSHGWVLLYKKDTDTNLASFRAAATMDSGKSWAMSSIRVLSQTPGELDGIGWLDFVDTMHGWALLHARSSSALSWGLLLATDDGGRNWKELPQAPVAARPVFVTPLEGWLVGPGWAGIYRTADGGKSWFGAGPSLNDLPASLPTRPSYEDMKFTDVNHGFLPIRLSPQNDKENPRGTALVLYVTADGGSTWKRNSTLTDRSFAKSGAPLWHFGASSLAPDSSGATVLIAAIPSDPAHPGRLTLALATRNAATTNESSEDGLRIHGSILGLSFISSTYGWAYMSSGSLLTTIDGGRMWRDVSPSSPRPVRNPVDGTGAKLPRKLAYPCTASNEAPPASTAWFSHHIQTVAPMALCENRSWPIPPCG